MECLLEKLCCRFGKKRFFVEQKATVQGLVVGLARGCRFMSRFGVSHGFVGYKTVAIYRQNGSCCYSKFE